MTPSFVLSRRWIRRRRTLIYIVAGLISLFVIFYTFCFLGFISRGNKEIIEINSLDTSATFWSRDILSEAYVLPKQNTVIHNPSSSQCTKGNGSNVYTLFMVISSPTGRVARDIIRSGMKDFLKDYFRQDVAGKKSNELLFFTGVSQGSTLEQVDLISEAKLHNDIVVDEFTESYFNLTLKSLRMLKWVELNCDRAEFTVKIDDDFHINLPKFFKFLEPLSGTTKGQDLIGGLKYNDAIVVRDATSEFGRWYTPKHFWTGTTFPPYVAGFFYILGLNSRKKIYTESLNQPLFHLEDVFVTGIIATHTLGMEITCINEIINHWTQFYNFYTTSCDIQNKYMGIHFLFKSFNYLDCWKRFNEKNFVCDNWPLVTYCGIG